MVDDARALVIEKEREFCSDGSWYWRIVIARLQTLVASWVTIEIVGKGWTIKLPKKSTTLLLQVSEWWIGLRKLWEYEKAEKKLFLS